MKRVIYAFFLLFVATTLHSSLLYFDPPMFSCSKNTPNNHPHKYIFFNLSGLCVHKTQCILNLIQQNERWSLNHFWMSQGCNRWTVHTNTTVNVETFFFYLKEQTGTFSYELSWRDADRRPHRLLSLSTFFCLDCSVSISASELIWLGHLWFAGWCL